MCLYIPRPILLIITSLHSVTFSMKPIMDHIVSLVKGFYKC